MKELAHTRRSSLGSFIVDRRGTILGYDEAMESLVGWPAIDVVGHNKDLSRSLDPGEQGERSIVTLPLYEGRIPMDSASRNLELTLHRREGGTVCVEAATGKLSGPGERVLVSVLRVLARSAAKAAESVVERHDMLTGLPDRDAFVSRLGAEFEAARLSASPLALVLVDIDHLREINDRQGRSAGDETLCKLAGVLRVAVEDERRIARLGDDDFAVLLPRAGRGEARQVAAGLRSAVERWRSFPAPHPGGRLRVTISLGAASFPADADSEVELMDRAREALDEARSMGRNRVWCYLRRPRVPVQVPVFFDGIDLPLVGYTRDLSPSGAFVQTSAKINVGMRCALAFPLPGHDGKVHVIGRVVRTVLPETSEDSFEVRIPGIGVEFERFCGPYDRRAIETFLHEHESETLRPESHAFSIPPSG